MTDIAWGPAGQTVFERTYSRPKPDGTHETWPETVQRVVEGNLGLVYGNPEMWTDLVQAEADELYDNILNFKILPAGRHLWASGVKGRQFLMNCWTAGWTDKLSDHFEFTFMRLMEGGGVGSNYSSHFLAQYGAPRRSLNVHIVCDPDHPDYDLMVEEGVLSSEYSHEWAGSFMVEDSREGWAAALVDLIDTYMTDDTVKHSNRVYDVTNVRPKGARLKTFGGTASGPMPFGMMMLKVHGVLNRAAPKYPEGSQALVVDSLDDEAQLRWYFPGVMLGDLDPETMTMEFNVVMPETQAQITGLQAMEIDHAIAECVVSGGVRRSARMAMMRWDNPGIFEFISCKANTGQHWTTNISVEIDDEFLHLLTTDDKGDGHFAVRKVLAHRVHEAVVNGMLTNGEPGYWNSSLSNVGEVKPVYCTNPCGEITLDEHEPCVLAHVNLDAFAPTAPGGYADEGGLIRAHELAVRFAMRATFGDITDPKSRAITDRNRRVGVGHTGVQDFIVKHGYRYSDIAVNERHAGFWWFRTLLGNLDTAVESAGIQYARDLRIPVPVKFTTVAPTGSISKLPGVAGEGIHPTLFRYYEQRIRFAVTDPAQGASVDKAFADGYVVETDVYDKTGNTEVVVYPMKNRLVEQVEALGYDAAIVEQADELSVDTLLAFQAMYQEHYADNAVSFTVNVPSGLPADEVSETVKKWLPKLKGTTIMVEATRPQAPFTRLSQEEYEASQVGSVGDGVDEDCATGACPIR